MIGLTGAHQDEHAENPGRYGSTATIEVEPRGLRVVHMSYAPRHDSDPDPGEIVWTWVPFEERDGRGKDRPVLIVAREHAGTVLAVELTSKRHDGSTGDDVAEWVALGEGPWDREGRDSWVNLERVFRLHPAGMRREAAALDLDRFTIVAARLMHLYAWQV